MSRLAYKSDKLIRVVVECCVGGVTGLPCESGERGRAPFYREMKLRFCGFSIAPLKEKQLNKASTYEKAKFSSSNAQSVASSVFINPDVNWQFLRFMWWIICRHRLCWVNSALLCAVGAHVAPKNTFLSVPVCPPSGCFNWTCFCSLWRNTLLQGLHGQTPGRQRAAMGHIVQAELQRKAQTFAADNIDPVQPGQMPLWLLPWREVQGFKNMFGVLDMILRGTPGVPSERRLTDPVRHLEDNICRKHSRT